MNTNHTRNLIAPLMIDVLATSLTSDDIERIENPAVGGVILFTRNYVNKAQLIELIGSIRSIKTNLLIAVDHEGGRVQRFQEGFTRLPAMAEIGKYYDKDKDSALKTAQAVGNILAYELIQVGVDFSFTPVLDVDYGVSDVIGNRAFHSNHQVLIELATALVKGIHQMGMKTVAKHFPGHGFVALDSHVDKPVDTRDSGDLQKDYDVFAKVPVDAIMPAHIIYPSVDNKPACFSKHWLDVILRQQLGFSGCVFSDDLSMQGAAFFNDISTRVDQALKAGCDMVLICNNPAAIDEVFQAQKIYPNSSKLVTMKCDYQQIRPCDIKTAMSRLQVLTNVLP